ncbi:MAG: YdeI/OmpD-associated family protein [Deltaproteobacteria bacterium]|nr:YdeI/OmpD-associated family protein [Deltaproteobacteria bacterium]
MNNTNADSFLADGCGRCAKFKTPACKALLWNKPLVGLRATLLASGLTEEMKWGFPCYTLGGKNVAMLLALKDHCGVSFFRGAELKAAEGLLESAGENAQASTQFRFRSLQEVQAQQGVLVTLLDEAIQLERAGAKKRVATPEMAMAEELALLLAENASLNAAWEALTPGRRRSHLLHVSGAKQAETRVRRAEGCVVFVLEGRGFNER